VIAAKQRAALCGYDDAEEAANKLLTLIDLEEESKRSRREKTCPYRRSLS
jgi:hypothetical protein